jgi:protocatechuate 3,4-dioxygenase beta subunit
MRPPHIHFAVSAPGVKTLLTQMYFSDSPLNAQDYLLNDIRQPAERQRLVVTLQAPPPSLQPAAQVAVFNLVLDRR